MSNKTKNRLLWLASIILTLSLVIYQRATGPTYPLKGNIEVAGETVSYKFLRSYDVGTNAPVDVVVDNKDVKGYFTYKRYKSHDEWQTLEMRRVGNTLKAEVPHQPAAGKVEYFVELEHDGETIKMSDKNAVLRYKGSVPRPILIPHIFFMFFAMLFGLRAGLEAIFKGEDNKYFTGIVLGTLTLGGLILGPIVQKYAFDAYWTGWPFGTDLTDNKTLFIFIFWLIAFLMVRRNHMHRLMVLVAMFFMIAVYIIPHSAMGSEIDHTKVEAQTTEQQIEE